MDILINQQKKHFYLFLILGSALFISIIYLIYFDVIREFESKDFIILSLILIIFVFVSNLILKINNIRKDLKNIKNKIQIDAVEAANIISEYADGDRGSIYTDKIKLHIKSIENKIYYFILNPAQYIKVINDLRKIAPGAKYILRVSDVFKKNKINKFDENLKINYI
jgi:hypothetical protein